MEKAEFRRPSPELDRSRRAFRSRRRRVDSLPLRPRLARARRRARHAAMARLERLSTGAPRGGCPPRVGHVPPRDQHGDDLQRGGFLPSPRRGLLPLPQAPDPLASDRDSRRDPLLIDRLSTLPPLLPLDPRAERSPPRARPRSGGRPRREQLSPLAVARPAPPVPAFRAREARDRAFRERFPRQSARAIPALLDGFLAALS